MPRVVITGGPGVGKTTLLAELGARGHATDTERDHAFAWVEHVHKQLVQWYRSCGYALCEVPRSPAAARATFVLQALAHGG